MNEYSSVLHELEDIRQGVKPKMLISTILLCGGMLGIMLGVFMMIPEMGLSFVFPLSVVATLVGLVLLFAWAEPARKEYAAIYKDSIVTRVMSKTMTKVMYEPKMGIDKNYIGATGFMMLGNRYKTEDLIIGSYKDVSFRRADVVIQDHRSNGKNSYTVTYFKGRWMVFEFNKNFTRDLQIIQRGFGYTKKKNSFFTSSTNRRHKIEFESVAFNNAFECLGQDDQEAFYLITPQIQEAMMNYLRTIDGRVMFGFKGNVLNVAIENGKDMLEPSIFREVSYENDILPVLQERNLIQGLVDLMKLDRNIYKA